MVRLRPMLIILVITKARVNRFCSVCSMLKTFSHRRARAAAPRLIELVLDGWKERCQPFLWTKDADSIIVKAHRQLTSNMRHESLFSGSASEPDDDPGSVGASRAHHPLWVTGAAAHPVR